jgi:membrane fusion protein, multidrug efflux system
VVLRGQEGTYAYVVAADGKAELRPIDVVQIQDGKAVVGKGLQAGETVVADGQYKIKPGVPVVAGPGKSPAPSAAAAGA